MNEFKDKAVELFKNNPKVDELYFTSDGKGFMAKHYAEGHAPSLKDKDVVSINRESLTAKPKVEKTPEEVLADQAAKDQKAADAEAKKEADVKKAADAKAKKEADVKKAADAKSKAATTVTKA